MCLRPQETAREALMLRLYDRVGPEADRRLNGLLDRLGTTEIEHSGRTLKDGKKLPLEVKVGDKVLVGKYSGSEIKLDDTDGAEMITILDKEGKNFIKIDTAENTISFEADTSITLKATNGAYSLTATGMEITSEDAYTLQATGDIEIKSDGNITLDGGGDVSLKAGGNITLEGSAVDMK